MISIVTPFMNGLDLLPDYEAATLGARLVLIDNGSDAETADALQSLPKERGIVIRNEANAGFAAANNQGYARAEGDIIVFLNSDIAADPAWLKLVADDVKDGALYGPSINQQLVYGMWLPYIEGWCIAATRATWHRLFVDIGCQVPGPWDMGAYPGPYWEDNDLCYRALQQDIALIQTHWPVQHKGGRTAGALVKHGATFEANRATFTRRVQSASNGTGGSSTPTHARYMQHVHTQSDIQHHLPLLYSLARGNVLELGTRSGVSTAALLAGVETRGGAVVSIDIDPACAKVAEGHPQWSFICADSRNPDLPAQVATSVDLLLIDTEHVYEIAQAELALWSSSVRPGGTILMHDPETFPGVRRAAQEFADAHGWPITFVLPCHGMAVITRPIEGVSAEGASWAMEGAQL